MRSQWLSSFGPTQTSVSISLRSFSKAGCVFFSHVCPQPLLKLILTFWSLFPWDLGLFFSSSFRIQLETHFNVNKKKKKSYLLYSFIHPSIQVLLWFIGSLPLRCYCVTDPQLIWVGILILVLFPQYVPPDLCICNFVLEQSLSVRALQEMLANTGEHGGEGVSTWIMSLVGVGTLHSPKVYNSIHSSSFELENLSFPVSLSQSSYSSYLAALTLLPLG